MINPAATYLVNSATYAEVGASLQDMVDEARTQYILGEISKVRLISTQQKWLEMGGAAIIEEVNANRRYKKIYLQRRTILWIFPVFGMLSFWAKANS